LAKNRWRSKRSSIWLQKRPLAGAVGDAGAQPGPRIAFGHSPSRGTASGEDIDVRRCRLRGTAILGKNPRGPITRPRRPKQKPKGERGRSSEHMSRIRMAALALVAVAVTAAFAAAQASAALPEIGR